MKCLRVILFCISRLSLCLISYNTKTFINCFTGFLFYLLIFCEEFSCLFIPVLFLDDNTQEYKVRTQ